MSDDTRPADGARDASDLGGADDFGEWFDREFADDAVDDATVDGTVIDETDSPKPPSTKPPLDEPALEHPDGVDAAPASPSVVRRAIARIFRRPVAWWQRPWSTERIVRVLVTSAVLVTTTVVMMMVVHLNPLSPSAT